MNKLNLKKGALSIFLSLTLWQFQTGEISLPQASAEVELEPFVITPNGQFTQGLVLKSPGDPQPYIQSGTWTASITDFISFVDYSPTPGFRVQARLESEDNGAFTYKGNARVQANIAPTYLTIYSNFDESISNYIPPTVDQSSVTATLNLEPVPPENCQKTFNNADFYFNEAFINAPYGLTMSSSLQPIFSWEPPINEEIPEVDASTGFEESVTSETNPSETEITASTTTEPLTESVTSETETPETEIITSVTTEPITESVTETIPTPITDSQTTTNEIESTETTSAEETTEEISETISEAISEGVEDITNGSGSPQESETTPTTIEDSTEPIEETPTEPTEDSTEPIVETPTEPTEDPTEPTEETPTEPTEDSTEPTEETPTEPTEDSAEPTVETPTEPTEVEPESLGEAGITAAYEIILNAAEITFDPTQIDESETCKIAGHLRLKRMVLNYPEGSNTGTYSSNLIILIIDGSN